MDTVGALGGRAPQVRAALNLLSAEHEVTLYVAYVSAFAGRSPQDWANTTAVRSGLGRRDVLLAVAVRDRQYAVSADQDWGLTQARLDEVGDAAVEPALRMADWAGAAIGAADGYAAVLSGRPVTPPDFVPGPLGPVRAAGTSNGAADLWIPVVAVVAAAVMGAYAFRRRRTDGPAARPAPAGRPRGRGRTGNRRPTPLTALPELEAQGRALLVATDDAVRTSQEDVALAAAQCGPTEAAPFAEAVAYARGELAAAFRLRQGLDETFPEDDGTRRQMLDEILSHCTQANRRLDAEADAFDRLRALESGTPELLEQAEARAVALPGRITAAGRAVSARSGPDGPYADDALVPVAAHPAEARDRLAFALTALDQVRTTLSTDRGRAAVFLRAAEGALTQAAALADSVTRRAQELRTADAALREALDGLGAALDARAAEDEHASRDVLAEVEKELAGGRYDPMAALRRVTEAGADLVRDGADGRALLGRAVLVAGSEVAMARDVVTTHRGAIGSRARTRLAEAERRLGRAQAPADGPASATVPVSLPGHGGQERAALEEARAADRLARDAQRLALEDLAEHENRFGAPAGGRRGDDDGTGGAVLGGILLGPDPGAGDGFGGFGGDSGGLGGVAGHGGPGSFGGGETRGRMGARDRT
ncbi:TPM domain-containing protein [Streptomyces sp. KK5PA1]|uniref:TPM domain-containing protein n=2 Tax=Actinacidiphila acididurans TaxID=2784346 RepID=A0ABS2TZ44_9ACTN|nr:TPM domain-containing protein [Actinacidiphila acididurans]